mgnify:CR=1 FL=1
MYHKSCKKKIDDAVIAVIKTGARPIFYEKPHYVTIGYEK